MKKFLYAFFEIGWSILPLVSFTLCGVLGNNYHDVYNPFWINVSILMMLASIIWGMLVIFVEVKRNY